jgi:hypothetical protein
MAAAYPVGVGHASNAAGALDRPRVAFTTREGIGKVFRPADVYRIAVPLFAAWIRERV